MKNRYFYIMEKEIKERIKELRKSKGITQKEMADKLGLAQSNYQAIESGKVGLTLDRLDEIAKILDTDVGNFIYPEFDKNSDAPIISKKIVGEFLNILGSTDKLLTSLLFFFRLLKEKNIDYQDLYKIAIKDYNKELLDIAKSFSEYSKRRTSHIPKEEIVTEEFDIDQMNKDANVIDLIKMERNKIRMVEKKYLYDIAGLLFGHEMADIIYRDASNNLNEEPKKKDD